MLTNDKLLQQIFMQFLQAQANVSAFQAPNIKSECTQTQKSLLENKLLLNKFLNTSKLLELALTLR